MLIQDQLGKGDDQRAQLQHELQAADRQMQLIAGHAPHRRTARRPPPAATPRLRVRMRARPFSGKRYTNFQQHFSGNSSQRCYMRDV